MAGAGTIQPFTFIIIYAIYFMSQSVFVRKVMSLFVYPLIYGPFLCN